MPLFHFTLRFPTDVLRVVDPVTIQIRPCCIVLQKYMNIVHVPARHIVFLDCHFD